MNCIICGGTCGVEYEGKIRKGGNEYIENALIYRCSICNHLFHEDYNPTEYYETTQYRQETNATSKVEDFIKTYDELQIDKFKITGTDCFRDKCVMDVGCAGGMFLDYLKSISSRTIAVEPSQAFRELLTKNGHEVYAYASEVEENCVDLAMSFDVIEHVDDPVAFAKDIHKTMKKGASLILGTPAQSKAYEIVLGDTWRSFNYRTQHISVFSAESLVKMADLSGFKTVSVENIHRYDLGNLLSWCLERRPNGNVEYPWITQTLNDTFKNVLAELGMGDYYVLRATKD